LADHTEGYTGADIASLSSAAVMLAMREHISKYADPKEADAHVKELEIHMRHFEEAMKKIRPLSTQELNMYKRMAEQFGKPELPTVPGGAGGVGSKAISGTVGIGTTGTEDPGIS
jgi:transitional endoplasmic reticulum ATPase